MENRTGRDLTTRISSREADRVEISVAGEIDLSSIEALRQTVWHAVTVMTPAVVALDMSQVRFCDCGGLGTLIGLHAKSAQAGTRITVMAASPTVERLLTLFELNDTFGYPKTPSDPPLPGWRGWPVILRHILPIRRPSTAGRRRHSVS